MAIYHFSGQIMSRISKHTGKPKSPLAAAAYRSGEKLTDEIDNTTFFYKRDVEPITHILIPSNAPEWASDRQRLWNEVNRVEKNYNAQFAREFNVALPVELNLEEQEKLALEFCKEAFVDRGMVADVAIHRDDIGNPHFHVMLTVRPFNEDGSWGVKAKRQYKFDENGNHILDKNGKKAFDKVDTTDWNKKDTFNNWRKLWAEKANQYLESNGIDEKISHLSNESRNIEQIPTIHEGYVARKMEKNGQESERVSFNKNVRKYNKTVSDLKKFKEQKAKLEFQEKFARKFSPQEKKTLSDIAKQLKMFVNVTSIDERKQQLNDWKKSITFRKDSESKLNQLSRIDKEENLIAQAEEIFDTESNRFIQKYYPTWDYTMFSLDEKVAIVDKTILNNRLLTEDELDHIEDEVYANNLLKEINGLIGNRFAFTIAIENQLKALGNAKNQLGSKMGITDKSSFAKAELRYPKEFALFKQIHAKIGDCFKAKDLMDEFYNLEIQKLYPSVNPNKLSLEEKEILIVGTEYYEKPITIESIPTLQRYATNDQINLIKLLASDSESNKAMIKEQYPTFQVDNPRYLLLFKDECLRNIKHLPDDISGLLKEINPEELADSEMNKNGLVKELNWKINNNIEEYTMHHDSSSVDLTGVTNGMFQGLLESRDHSSKKQFEDDLKSKSKTKSKKRSNSGPSL